MSTQFQRKASSLPASSILESVIALCIVAVCVYVSILIYATVFTPTTSIKFYNSRNKLQEYFFIVQTMPDSAFTEETNISSKEEWLKSNLKKIEIEYRDSTGIKTKKQVYITQ